MCMRVYMRTCMHGLQSQSEAALPLSAPAQPYPPGGCGSRHQVMKPRLLARIAQRVLDAARQNVSTSTALQRACLAKVEGACWARMTRSSC